MNEVRILPQQRRVALPHSQVTGTDQVGGHLVHDLDAAAVHAELKAVAQHRGLIGPDLHLAADQHLLQKVVVAGEGHLLAVDFGAQDRVILGLTGGEVDVEGVLLPIEALPVAEGSVDTNGLVKGTGGGAPGGRVGQHLGHRVQGPAAGAVELLQVRDAAGMVVVDMGGNGQVQGVHAVLLAELLEMVLDEPHDLQPIVVGEGVHVGMEGVAVVDEQRLSRTGEDHVEEGAGPGAPPEEMV